VRSAPAVLLALSLAGCATTQRPLNSGILFTSEPTGAEVIINAGYFGRTPVRVNLKKDIDYAVMFRAPGYADRTYQFNVRAAEVHGVLTATGPGSDSAAAASTSDPGRGSVTGAYGARPAGEAKRIDVLPDAPITVTLFDGTMVGARMVEPAGPDYVKVTLTDGKASYMTRNKIRSITTPAPQDWTKAVLEEGRRVPPR
jgi:PEGA domain-containing protein